ncbi:hypothetical protein DPMN_004101 [Dreissena polymorpha]|uniref:Uncharacterized protein n=1 Tax=Dreissena polymorpha TaxID=45954 RepID=A0A9D4MPQ1_DREPO|nr:hypothetical protein DPMN_004101 [Dreissena polymorpha]
MDRVDDVLVRVYPIRISAVLVVTVRVGTVLIACCCRDWPFWYGFVGVDNVLSPG